MSTPPDNPLAALAAGIERVTRRLDTVTTKQDTLTKAVAQLVRAQEPDEREPLVPSLDNQPPAAVVDLLDWLERIYLAYDGATLGACWCWHPGVVEELTWLRGAHQAVYATRDWVRVGDWHDRMRPGVVRRVSDTLRACHIDDHRPTPAGPTVPLADALGPIAAARATEDPVPAPTDEQTERARQLSTQGTSSNHSKAHQ